MGNIFADLSPVRLMTLPFVECLVLVGIHSYLGLHVIRRQVIFVDLSLAQIAALGTTVGFLFGIHPHGVGGFLFSLSFTFLGATVFALTRSRKERVPQEAIIGLVYALAAAAMILVIDRAPHGAEHIKEVLTGSILWVKQGEVISAAVAYTVIGAFHWVFRDRFMAITRDAQAARDAGINVMLWDLIFYMTFGFVITFSVNTAGVLLVFVFLVVPAVIGVAITDSFKYQLIIGWTLGTLVSLLGLASSYWLDLPSGPAVVSLYGIVLLLVALILYVIRAANRRRALAFIGLGGVAVLVLLGYFYGLRSIIEAVPSWKHGDHAQFHAVAPEPPKKKTPLGRFEDLDLESKSKAVQKMKDLKRLKRFFVKATTPGGKLKLAERVTQLDSLEGARLLLAVLESNAPPYFRDAALQKIGGLCKRRFTVDLLEADEATAAKVIADVRRCVRSLGDRKGVPAMRAPGVGMKQR